MFPHSLPRILIVAGREPLRDGAGVPGKASRLIDHARRVVQRSGAVADVLDLGWMDRAAGQAAEWAGKVRERWNAAHGVVLIAPERWNMADSSLRFLLEELARDASHAHEIAYGAVLHGEHDPDRAGYPELQAHLEEMGLVPALDAAESRCAREGYPGYYEPGDGRVETDRTLHERVREVARAVVTAARRLRGLPRGQRDAAGLASLIASSRTSGTGFPPLRSQSALSSVSS
jgi:hypothetical protein